MFEQYQGNRTSLYLAPIVYNLSSNLANLLGHTKVEAWGIYDELYQKAYPKKKIEHRLFIVHNIKPRNKLRRSLDFNDYLKQVRALSCYCDDYIFDIRQPNYHVTVIKITKKWHDTYNHFINGEFSKMYTPLQLSALRIEQYLPNKGLNKVFLVLTRDKRYKKVFIKRIQEAFGTRAVPEKIHEFDSFNVDERKEILNASFTGIKKFFKNRK